MTNKDILVLVNSGCQSITNHDLSDAHAYKVYKFKKALREALEARQAEEKIIAEGEKIDNLTAFLNNPETPKNKEQLARIKGLIDSLNASDVKASIFEGVKTMPYSEWRKLQNENRRVPISFTDKNGDERNITLDVLVGHVEEILEGVLWDAPEDEDAPKKSTSKKK